MKKLDAKKELLKKRKKLVISESTALSTGSTLLNLALTDNPNYGFVKGCYYFLVGDSTSGKTWLTLTCLAESQLHSNFKDYELHFDDVEGGAMMDIERYFGKKMAQKLQRHSSQTIQEFYRRLYDLLVKQKKKILYVLDSQDALDNSAAQKKFRLQAAQAAAGQKEVGSMGDGKAKYHSENIRWVNSALRRTGSILLIIGQTRENVNAFGFMNKKTRSGGKSLRFYAACEMWSSVAKPIKKTVRDKPRIVGSNCIVEVRKNRITGKIGKERSALIPIYQSHGIDDTGSMIDFLVAENALTEVVKDPSDKKKRWKLPEIDFAGTRGELIRMVEENDAEDLLKDQVHKIWKEIEDECQLVNRKRRYE